MINKKEVSVCCGADIKQIGLPCPDNMPGCCVYHCQTTCSKCGGDPFDTYPKEEINYMQMGKTFECSNCKPEKGYADYHKEVKCECICHSPKEEYIIKYCNKCIQMTNHIGRVCQKCLTVDNKEVYSSEEEVNTYLSHTKHEMYNPSPKVSEWGEEPTEKQCLDAISTLKKSIRVEIWEEKLKEMIGDVRRGVRDDVCIYDLIRKVSRDSFQDGYDFKVEEIEEVNKIFPEYKNLICQRKICKICGLFNGKHQKHCKISSLLSSTEKRVAMDIILEIFKMKPLDGVSIGDNSIVKVGIINLIQSKYEN